MTHKQELRTLCESVMHWVKTPGNHGGNPYGHDFVKVAERMLEGLDKEERIMCKHGHDKRSCVTCYYEVTNNVTK